MFNSLSKIAAFLLMMTISVVLEAQCAHPVGNPCSRTCNTNYYHPFDLEKDSKQSKKDRKAYERDLKHARKAFKNQQKARSLYGGRNGVNGVGAAVGTAGYRMTRTPKTRSGGIGGHNHGGGHRHHGKGLPGGIDERVSLLWNYNIYSVDDYMDGQFPDMEVEESVETSLNLRVLTGRNFAFRFGAGFRELDYSLSNLSGRLYDGFRKDYTLILGLEKHFHLPIVDIYPGIFVPIEFVGYETIPVLFEEDLKVENDNVRASLGFLLGANVRVLRVLRLGAEINASYKDVKQKVSTGLNGDKLSELNLKGMRYSVDFVIGIAF